MTFQPESGVGRSARGDFKLNGSTGKGWYGYGSTQRGQAEWNFLSQNEILAASFKNRVGANFYFYVEIARRPSVGRRLSFTRHTEFLTFFYARGDFYGNTLGRPVSAAVRYNLGSSLHNLFQREWKLVEQVLSFDRGILPKSSLSPGRPFKQVLESETSGSAAAASSGTGVIGLECSGASCTSENTAEHVSGSEAELFEYFIEVGAPKNVFLTVPLVKS